MEEVGKCVRGWGSVEERMGLVWMVEGSVLGCGDEWGRCRKVWGAHSLFYTFPNSSSQPLYSSSNTSPYLLYHLLHTNISRSSHLLPN